ncbi:MAG: glycogen/starch synthase [Bacteroides sp.]|nr:glycogen/starch synthase [Prevotella sp.]MCM1407934.1 glycogen/starch synthase [Treponema brennaborense]MCM1469676.1 glycogen/starch synthase [Bacteroides sp.]
MTAENAQAKPQHVWIVTREYAGIAEAGGVKDVACSLSEQLAHSYAVTVFIPLYGCSILSGVSDYRKLSYAADIPVGNGCVRVEFAQAVCRGVRFIFVIAPCFAEKKAVYTYTAAEEAADPSCRRGTGHKDALEMNVVFQKAVLAFGLAAGETPAITHCQDAAAALVPFLAAADDAFKAHYARTRYIVTVHNAGAGYHHAFDNADQAAFLLRLPRSAFENALNGGRAEPFLLACSNAAFTTVSPWYAEELTDRCNTHTDGLSAAFAERALVIAGITNGIDFDRYDPRDTKKSLLPFPYNPETGDLAGKTALRNRFVEYFSHQHDTQDLTAFFGKDDSSEGLEQFGTLTAAENECAVYFSYHGRLVQQKGLSVFAAAAEKVLEKEKCARFIVTGQGQSDIVAEQKALAYKYPGRYLFLHGYDRTAARSCVASADFLVLPSFFEPCGLEDFIAQIFGTLPVAHAAGGLNKIIDGKTGFLFRDNTAETLSALLCGLCGQLQTCPERFAAMIQTAAEHVRTVYSWETVVSSKYIPLYRSLSADK